MRLQFDQVWNPIINEIFQLILFYQPLEFLDPFDSLSLDVLSPPFPFSVYIQEPNNLLTNISEHTIPGR